MLGCDGEPPTGYWRENLIDGRDLLCCPQLTRRMAPAELRREMDRMWSEYYPLYSKDGHLLVTGGIADQPARFMEYMRAIGETVKAMEAKHTEIAKGDGK